MFGEGTCKTVLALVSLDMTLPISPQCNVNKRKVENQQKMFFDCFHDCPPCQACGHCLPDLWPPDSVLCGLPGSSSARVPRGTGHYWGTTDRINLNIARNKHIVKIQDHIVYSSTYCVGEARTRSINWSINSRLGES